MLEIRAMHESYLVSQDSKQPASREGRISDFIVDRKKKKRDIGNKLILVDFRRSDNHKSG